MSLVSKEQKCEKSRRPIPKTYDLETISPVAGSNCKFSSDDIVVGLRCLEELVSESKVVYKRDGDSRKKNFRTSGLSQNFQTSPGAVQSSLSIHRDSLLFN